MLMLPTMLKHKIMICTSHPTATWHSYHLQKNTSHWICFTLFHIVSSTHFLLWGSWIWFSSVLNWVPCGSQFMGSQKYFTTSWKEMLGKTKVSHKQQYPLSSHRKYAGVKKLRALWTKEIAGKWVSHPNFSIMCHRFYPVHVMVGPPNAHPQSNLLDFWRPADFVLPTGWGRNPRPSRRSIAGQM